MRRAQVGMRRYEVKHVTTYSYEDVVTSSFGFAYLVPRNAPGQVCSSATVSVTPDGVVSSSTDFFGNRASYFEVHTSHRTLTVTALSTVEVDREVIDLADLDDRSWDAPGGFEGAAPRSEAAQFRLESPRLPTAAAAPLASTVFTPGRPLGESLTALVHDIYRDFAYRSGVTTVSSSLTEVMQKREGVCQDFAHVAVAALRWAGLPARYVSGYLETMPPPGQPKLQGADASHAWASVLVPGVGWVDLDPTNDQLANSSYVVTAWGRDYSDVPPLKGVIFTESASSTLDVAVDVIRLPAPAPSVSTVRHRAHWLSTVSLSAQP